MSTKYHWANPVQTSGWQNYPNGWVYSSGIGMPTTRLDFFGNRPIRIHSFGDYYITGAGSFMRMNYLGVTFDGGGAALFGSSGGSFQWEAHQGNISNQMFFGRDPGCCTVTSFNDGFVWAGLLAGSFWWDQVPNPPGLSVVISGRSATLTLSAPDNGGTPIDVYSTQWSKDGGAWQAQRNVGNTTYTDLVPGSYRFRAWAHNAVGSGQPTTSGSFIIRAGGKRFNGAAYNANTIAKRLTASGWQDLTIAKRLAASGWVDLS